MTHLRGQWQRSTIIRSTRVLSARDQRKVIAVTILQICLGLLDLLGVLVVGLLGALSVTGVQSAQPDNRVNFVLELLHISDLSFQSQAAILVASAAVLLVGRTLISILFTRRILFFFSRRGAEISANLVSRLLSQSLLTIKARTTQETLFSVTRGVEVITLQVLATLIVLVADVSLLVVMGIGLFVVDPVTATGTLLVFTLIGVLLYQFMHVRAHFLGVENSRLNIKSNGKIVEVFSSFRESVVRNRRDYYAREIKTIRFNLANNLAELNFMPYISKYVIETTVLLGALLIGATQFVLRDATHAVATLTIFLAAGTRIAPAVLRVQQGAVQIQGSLGMASSTLDMIDALSDAPFVENVDDSVEVVHEGFVADIQVEGATFTYPEKLNPAIVDITLKIPAGSSVAFVGPSGAGKTTIIDVILGVLKPDIGRVMISGLPPLVTFAKWPGAVSYVPQDVEISDGSIRENVALGFPIELAQDDLVMSALKIANLEDFVAGLPLGIDTPVGERGAKISGGQRQRLGIARAMFTKPNLLVLDEATSSLDGKTEASISRAIQGLRGSTTVVMIAHKLSTIRSVDMIVYMAAGKVVASGTFDQVRKVVPDFDRQAKLLGL